MARDASSCSVTFRRSVSCWMIAMSSFARRVTKALQSRSAIHVEQHFAERHVEENARIDVVEMSEAVAVENYMIRESLGIALRSGKKNFLNQRAIVCQSRGCIA